MKELTYKSTGRWFAIIDSIIKKVFIGKSLLSATLPVLVLFGLTMTARGEPAPIILESTNNGISDPIDVLAAAHAISALGQEILPFQVRMPMSSPNQSTFEARGLDFNAAAVQHFSGPFKAQLLQIFDGARTNVLYPGEPIAPGDSNGDVGPNHYVQMVNVLTTIFDKSGNVLVGPFPNNLFWSGTGGLCELTNHGDPIVLYDESQDKWLVSQFALSDPNYSLCIAISTTGDPTGTYFQHEFDFTNTGLPDYPKYGFVTGAIGVMVNLFDNLIDQNFVGPGLGAIDKAEACSEFPATMVFFNLGPSQETGFIPGDNDGPVFNNMPPTFATNNGFMGSTIDFWEIKPDFVVPLNSTISEVATIPVSPFNGDVCSGFGCMLQPDPGFPFLDARSDRLMPRLQLRDFGGGDKRAVVNHAVDAQAGTLGLRWYEFRNDGTGWSLHQENTFSPDYDDRALGSIAMNRSGDICLGYNISGRETNPSIAVAGQTVASSGTGLLDVGEEVILAGPSVQTDTYRWGDYSAMAVDPITDNFWYTQQYAPGDCDDKPSEPQFRCWATKIAEIQHPIRVVIDIKPGSDPNSINCENEKEVITLAILTTDDFDALTVNPSAVMFEGASETHVNKNTGEPLVHVEDVDADGSPDRVFHFRLSEMDWDCASTEGMLTGETFDGTDVWGVDAVRMVD